MCHILKKLIQTISYINIEFVNDIGLYGSAYDADSEGVEGKFYTWSFDELSKVLQTNLNIFAKKYLVTNEGNFEGKNILVEQNNDLDERTLTAIADLTGGKYFRARDPRELRSIYDQLNKLEPIDQDEELLRPITSLFHWPLALFLTCSLLIILIRLFSDKKS